MTKEKVLGPLKLNDTKKHARIELLSLLIRAGHPPIFS